MSMLILQDEEFGGFGGPHCMVKGGYGQIPQAMAACLDVQLNSPVTSIAATESSVSVTVQSGECRGKAVHKADSILHGWHIPFQCFAQRRRSPER